MHVRRAAFAPTVRLRAQCIASFSDAKLHLWLKAFCALWEPAARPVWAVVGKRKKSGRSKCIQLSACVHPIFHARFSTSLHIPLIGLLHHSASRHWRALHSSSSFGLLPNWHGYKSCEIGPNSPNTYKDHYKVNISGFTDCDRLAHPPLTCLPFTVRQAKSPYTSSFSSGKKGLRNTASL